MEIHRADPELRRRMAYVFAATAIGAVLGYVLFREWLASLADEPVAVAKSKLVFAIGVLWGLACASLLAAAAYLWRLGGQVVSHQRHPLPGARLVHDARAVSGAHARRLGRFLQLTGVVLLCSGVVGAVVAVRGYGALTRVRLDLCIAQATLHINVEAQMLPAVLLMLLAVVGVSLAGRGVLQLYRVLGVKRWPRTTAVILEQSIACEPVVIEQSHPAYYPVVRFRYESATGARESDKLSLVPKDYRSFDRHVVEQELLQFPVGATVTALVCPSNPGVAVLRAVSNRTRSHYMALLLGGTLLLVACALLAPLAVP